MMKPVRILIVDDEPVLRDSLVAILEQEITDPITCDQAATGKEALHLIEKNNYDLVIMDVKMPEMDGLTALQKIKEIDPKIFVVILTAHSNVRDAIEAIREGAYDYLEKPILREKVVEIYRKSQEAKNLVADVAASLPIFDDDINTDLLSTSDNMKEVFDMVYKVSKADTTVLIHGESGTGKELVARAIHYNSYRKFHPFIAINCGSLTEDLMDSELFGHEKGAFTGADERKIGIFQLANDGTLFLDEVAELKMETQVKLLRVLQEKKFSPVGSHRELETSARIIASTNQNLDKKILEGTFREDLYHRLKVIPLFLPPLREHPEDIARLTQHFLQKYCEPLNRPVPTVSPEALAALRAYKWPGNIRELENVIERIVVVHSDPVILPQHLPGEITESVKSTPLKAPLDYEKYKDDSARQFIIDALKANSGKINQTVANANIPKNTLLRKIKKYNINPKDYAKK
ncbi:MAG: sigma-54-dependent Fis family transcriptional regulator [Bdellovibrionaceae bacterium]|nr:sigma-54-dependent Fis family transcriptional regulator [Pseudobdellovibrionaceae bacterium]